VVSSFIVTSNLLEYSLLLDDISPIPAALLPTGQKKPTKYFAISIPIEQVE
jgi:hypothetical protein